MKNLRAIDHCPFGAAALLPFQTPLLPFDNQSTEKSKGITDQHWHRPTFSFVPLYLTLYCSERKRSLSFQALLLLVGHHDVADLTQ